MNATARWLLAAGLFCLLLPVRAAQVSLPATADTYFEMYGSEDRNFGSAAELRVDQWHGRQALLRFALAELPAGRHISGARLRLYVTASSNNEAGPLPELSTCLGLYDVVTPWTEAGATYRSADGQKPWSQGPGIGGPKYADVGPVPTPDIGVHLRQPVVPFDPRVAVRDTWIEFDLTDYLRGRLRAGEREVSLLVRGSVLARNWTFRSREATQVDQRPQLAVDLADGPDFRLDDATRLDWQPGQPVNLTSGAGLTWSLLGKPAASRLTDASLRAAATGATFVPDVPGRYRVKCARANGDEEIGAVTVLSVPGHPRLYVTPAKLVALRRAERQASPVYMAFKARVDAGNSGLAKGQYHDFGLPEGCEDNALMYLLTKDSKYADTSAAYAQRILAKPMPEHFRDVHDATYTGAAWVQAMALHYDYCFDRLSAEQRQAIVAWLRYAGDWAERRSGRPVAHNDGGARQMILGAVALALAGDDPDAPRLLARAQDNFDDGLLPWLNDGGQGGRCGDGGEYEGLHGFYIVKYAAMASTATGADVFAESPYFRARLSHILFGWYPRRLVERNGAYSMRTYYSPAGDHIRLGYVGDTQPYQSAALLCDRYRDTPEAAAVRWSAGDWPTQTMQYCLKWALLGDWEGVPAKQPTALTYLDRGCQTLYARSDWSDDATWLLFENPPYVSAHDSLYAGGFEIFKGDLLAARTGNLDHGNIGATHAMNYLHRTIATNSLLIDDPKEKWKGFLAGADGIPDGGGQRTNWPLTSSPEGETYRIYRPIFQRGAVTRFADRPELTYALADITGAYNSPVFHGGTLNVAKVSNVTRQLVYLRGLDTVAVFDRVTSTDPSYRKTFLLHSLGDLDVLDGTETKVDDGESTFAGATRAVIRYGWAKPQASFARCQSVTLLPQNAVVRRIGGRTDLPAGQTESFPGDQWHQQHRHHHVKDFWVNGRNYPPGNPPEARWFGEPTSQYFVPGTPDETGGRGKWRIEVSPSQPAADDVFFHVLSPRLGSDGAFPSITRLAADGHEGALITEGAQRAAVFFSRAEAPAKAFATSLPAGDWLLAVFDLAPGDYTVTIGAATARATVGADGLLLLPKASGAVKVVAAAR